MNIWRRYIHSTMHPIAYHGYLKRGPFFEGWYYKMVSKDGAQRFSVIPGVYIGKDASDSHCFIQVLNGVTGKSLYIPYPYEAFQASQDVVNVAIADNFFTMDEIHLDIEHAEISLHGDVQFHDQKPFPVSVTSPGIMGWFAWVPAMECYHGIVSMDHVLHGSLHYNKENITLTGGRGYIEKDWGKAMPKAWIWMQSNQFTQKGVSLSASIATIPWMGFSFKGFIVALLLDDGLHRFATYNGSKITKLKVDASKVQIVLSNTKERLYINAERVEGSNLQAPTVRQMDRRIMETLSAKIHVMLYRRNKGNWEKVFDDQGMFGGLEVVGDLVSPKYT